MGRSILVLALVVLLIGYPAALFLRSTQTFLEVESPVKVVGVDTPVGIVAMNPHGVRRFTATLKQGGKSYPLVSESQAARRWSILRDKENPKTFHFSAGSNKAKGLQDGKAVLRIDAVSNDLRARTDTLSLDIEVNTRPPALQVDEAQHYINLGGSELVTFTASGYWTEAGVRVGKYTFRSYPLPGAGDPNRRVCLFAYPYDTPAGETPVVYARNPTGAEATARFWNKIFRKEFRHRELILSDDFLNKVLNELDPGGSGDTIARFLKLNQNMRVANNQSIADLRDKTADHFLWDGPFVQLANSSVEAQFCDYRKYFYNHQSVDEQVHLGFDLAVTAHTPVVAANNGRVVYADKLGIYGHAIVIDHGLGLQSLYGHLSAIGVKPGQDVKRGDVIGRSGATGMAGGDHLHFGMQVDGISVNPMEWWDGHWLQDRILARIQPAAEKR